jgi:hypothetical protein
MAKAPAGGFLIDWSDDIFPWRSINDIFIANMFFPVSVAILTSELKLGITSDVN